tara:strand:- start:226 stop:522 length:297 start_codon:yes stop_codon:yes gene_type:complete
MKHKKAVDILNTAIDLVGGDRSRQHGDLWLNHQNIAQLWNGYLWDRFEPGDALTAADVADLMELLKVARRKTGTFNPDDYIDGAAYSAISYELRRGDK